ncbi:MAG: AAA family ATPase [Eubacteriales bacterium]
MIIKSISAENFGKFDRYTVNLDDNINVFYGDNEAGKTTLYEIISILLFAPSNDQEMAESNKLIKTDEKYARVYAIINMDDREISIAREIYVNNTNLSIADQDNVSSLGNVNVPFIGNLTKEMYESFHTIDYYNMATITNNVWQQIVKMIEGSHGLPRVTPNYSSPEEEQQEEQKKPSSFEEQINEKENEKKELEGKLKQAKKAQKRMIKNQDKIDDLLNDLEDVENNIELESSYLREAEKMNQIRDTIKKTQDLALELEKYKDLQEWMPNLKAYYERLKLYSENIENGIENPIDMFDDLEIEEAEQAEAEAENKAPEPEENAQAAEMEPEQEEMEEEFEQPEPVEAEEEEFAAVLADDEEDDEETEAPEEIKEEAPAIEMSFEEKLRKFKMKKEQIAPSEEKEDGLAKDKISEYIEQSYLNYEHSKKTNADDPYADDDDDDISEQKEEPIKTDFIIDIEKLAIKKEDKKETKVEEEEVKPLEIRKPKDISKNTEKDESIRSVNIFGQTNPYADNIFPNMDDVKYSDEGLSKEAEDEDTEENDKYSSAASNDLPTQSKKVDQKDMSKEEKEEDQLHKVEEFLNSIDMQEIIAASKETVEVDSATQEEIDKAKLRYEIIARRVFKKEMDTSELSDQLKVLDTNAIYKSIVKYKSLSQKQRKLEHGSTGAVKAPRKSSTNGEAVALGIIAFFSMIIGLACFFIDQVMAFLPNNIEFLNKVVETMKNGLLLKDIIPGNLIAGGAFVLIAILLIIATALGKDDDSAQPVQVIEDDVQLEDLKNSIRAAKREVIDILKGFPLPAEYLENPNNTIISVINELREADEAYNDIILESTMPKNKNYRTLWKVSKKHLSSEEISDDLFDNISKLRRKIQDHKEAAEEKEKKLNDAKMRINMMSGNSINSNTQDDDDPLSGLGGFGNVNNSMNTIPNNTASSNSFALPKTQSSDLGGQSSQNLNVSEKPSFGLPGASEPSYGGSEFTTSQDTSYPSDSGSSTFGTSKDASYPGDSGGSTFGTNQDASYSSDSASMFGNVKDTSYPGDSSGSTFGTSQDASYPGDSGNTLDANQDASYSGESASMFGNVKDTSYPGDSSGSKFGTSQDASYPTDNSNPFGSEKDSSYSADDNPFNKSPELNIPEEKSAFGLSGNSEDSPQGDDFGIPGIRRYGSDAAENTEQPIQASQENNFGLPGINKYDNEEPKEKINIEDNTFNIPGVVRYTNDTPIENKQEQQPNSFGSTISEPPIQEAGDQTPVFNDFKQNESTPEPENESKGFGLPGLDKFSNRGEQAFQSFGESKPSDSSSDMAEPIIPPIAGAAEAGIAAAAAGSVISSGLPGLDKFSNRGDQLKKEEISEAADTVEEADDFGIPGIHRYSGTEQKSETQFKFPETSETIAPEIAEEEPEVQEQMEAEQYEEPPIVEEEKPERIKDRRELEYERLLELLGEDPEATIRNVEDISRELHREIIKRDKAMAELLKLNDAAVRLSTLSSNKWPYKEKAVEASRERIDYLEADKLKLTRHLEMLTGKIEDIPYEETPQAISDRIKAIDEEIEQLKLESDKHAIAEEILEKQKSNMLDMSSSADRSHIIEDTSVYMKELTLGKYVQAKINEEQTGLAICDKDGQWFDTTKDRLSQATREQLYLALRISIADLFDEKSLIFPMFFDEALITWDKRRMKAVMRLLSKMSMHRQVIIFTCHDWLKDMISEYLIGAKIIMM